MRELAKTYESLGDIKASSDLFLSLQVETFGSMEPKDKISFLIEQVRLAIAMDDFTQAQIIGRKISAAALDRDDFKDLRNSYLEEMVLIAIHGGEFLNAASYCLRLYKSGAPRYSSHVRDALIFAILADISSESTSFIRGCIEELGNKTPERFALHTNA